MTRSVFRPSNESQGFSPNTNTVIKAWDRFKRGLNTPDQSDIQDFLIHWIFKHMVKKNPQKYLYCNFSETIQNLTELLWERELDGRENMALRFVGTGVVPQLTAVMPA